MLVRSTQEDTMRRVIIAIVVAGAAIFFGRGWEQWGTAAAPITCPPPQVAVHDFEGVPGWVCVNHGGNPSGANETKNPND